MYARRVYSVIKNKDMYYAKYLIDVMMVWGGGGNGHRVKKL